MYCSACDEVLVDNITIPATGVHTEVSIPGREATCTEEGLTEGKSVLFVARFWLRSRKTLPRATLRSRSPIRKQPAPRPA